MAVQNPIWNGAAPNSEFEVIFSKPSSSNTENTIPNEPAASVSVTLSIIICPRICLGVAPMALRIPISVVLSFTVTIIMFETPMAPARMVPRPISSTSMFSPRNRLSTIPNNCSVFTRPSAGLSVGSNLCSRATIWRILSSREDIFTPFLPVIAIRSTLEPPL